VVLGVDCVSELLDQTNHSVSIVVFDTRSLAHSVIQWALVSSSLLSNSRCCGC
jgi:hypothetical protein